MYYQWIQKSIRSDVKYLRPKKPRYQIAWLNHTYRFIRIAYTEIENKDLVWEDFLGFYEFMILGGEVEAYVFETYPELMNFVWSWGDYRNNKGVLLVGKDCIGLFRWRLGLGRASSKWCMLYLKGIDPFSWANQRIRKTNCHKLYPLHLLHQLHLSLLQRYDKQHLHQTHHTHNVESRKNTHHEQRDEHGLIKFLKKYWILK